MFAAWSIAAVAAVASFINFGNFAAHAADTTNALPEVVAHELARHSIPPRAVSIEVRDMQTNESILRVNAARARNPASVIKILTTLSALELLGPQHRWRTEYYADGAIRDGVLHGDLILRGGGDPFIRIEDLLAHILALRQLGIVEIAGDLVIDNSLFAPDAHDRAAFDGKPRRMYNVGADAALINFAATRFVLTPLADRAGATQIHLRAEPPLDGLAIDNQLTVAAGKCRNPNAGWSMRIVRPPEQPGQLRARFRGHYQSDCGVHELTRSIIAGPEYAYRAFAALWRMMGGQLRGYRIGITPPQAQLLTARESESLGKIIADINKYSNNAMARQLLLTIGAELHTPPATRADAIAVVRQWLADNTIAMPKLKLQNGAGLSRDTRASAIGLSALLARAWQGDYRPEFVASLPLAALDGTMRKRLPDSPLRARARIKTGLIDYVRSMAGYVFANDGRHYGIVMMIDSRKVNFDNGNAIQDAALKWVFMRR